MAARKTALKKSAGLTENIAVLETQVVPVKDLAMHHKNPRRGNVDLIAESLKEHGQFRPILVNKGTITGRQNEILAGNHTFLGVRRLGWDSIYVSFVDVDEETATKIVLADNKTSDAGTYDDAVLAELFNSLPDLTGTGYNDLEVDAIMADLDKALEGAVTETEMRQQGIEEEEKAEARKKTFVGSEFGEEPEPGDEGYEDDAIDPGDDYSDHNDEVRSFAKQLDAPKDDSIEEESEELAGLVDLKDELPEDEKFYAPGYWQLPALRSDMFAKESDIPWDRLKAWAGSASKEDIDPERWWLYNWGIDSTSGMTQDKSQVIVGFYAFDEYFENWFWTPKKYVTKLLNSRIKFALTPNFSQWPTQSRFLNLWATYRSRWVGRYMQEAGIKVIPDIVWPMGDNEYLKKYVLGTLPRKGAPLIAMQMQTFDDDEMKKFEKVQKQAFQLVVDTLKPEAILLYANRPGYDWFTNNVEYTGNVHRLETRLYYLGEKAKQRKKKTGI